MWGHCSARGQIGTGPVRAALAGSAWALHSIVGWGVATLTEVTKFKFRFGKITQF